MLALNLPGFAPKVAEKDGKRTIFDPVRQKYVALTPEEWVRQHFVNYLITRKSYPKELLANEVLVKLVGIIMKLAPLGLQTLRYGCLQPFS